MILYGYDSNEETGCCYTSRDVYREAEALLQKLLRLRTEEIRVCLLIPPPRRVSLTNHSIANNLTLRRIRGDLYFSSPMILAGL